MKEITLAEEKRTGRDSFKSLDMAVYARKRFGMFDGREEKVHLLCQNRFAGIIIDRFGKDIPFRKADNEYFEVTVEVAVSEIFLGWIMGLGDGVRITGPENVVGMMREEIRRLVDTYGG